MDRDTIAIALTVIGLLGSLAVTMIALFFRVGLFKGETVKQLEHIVTESAAFRHENAEAHDGLSLTLSEHHGRIATLEERSKPAQAESQSRKVRTRG